MKIEVTAFPRAQQGSGASRRLRLTGRVPGIVYGADKAAQNVEVEHKALLRNLGLEAFHASILDMTLGGEKFQALVGRHEASGVWLMLPQSHMNLSGRPVQMLASFFKIAAADILVAHDDLDFAAGTVRMKQGGGVAGHNGLKDISARLGTHDYWRLRVGIGHPGNRDEVTNYVLGKPVPEDRAAIDAAIGAALEVMPLVLAGDLQGAMLKLHSQPAVERPAQPEKAEKPRQAQADPASQSKPPKRARKPETPAGKIETGATTELEPGKAGKPGGLGSFFKKFLPDSGPTPKK